MLRTSFLILIISLSANLFAQDSIDTEAPRPKKFSILVSAGKAIDDFHWSIAGTIDGTSPNIYSELIWSDLKGTPIKLDAQWNFWKSFLLRTRISRMSITSGTVSDTDYEGDNRTSPVFHVTVDASVGSISSFTAEAGYQIMKGNTFQLNGYAGYTDSRQDLFLLDPEGKFDKRLKSTYETTWKGALIALEATAAFGKVVSVTAHATYHQVSYNAQADWNLIEAFEHPVSFEHRAKGFGIEGSFQVKFNINEDIGFFLDTTYSDWQTGKGTDILYLADGQVQHTQLNEVIRTSLAFGAGMMVKF